MTYSRWRRRGLTGLGDIADLVTALGGDSVVPAFYDYRTNVTASGGVVDAWGDARGTGGGPDLTATTTARPTLSAVGLTFNGTTNALLASAGRLAEIVGDCGMAAVITFPTVTGVEQRLVELGTAAGGAGVLLLTEAATTGNLGAVGAGAVVGLIPAPIPASNYPNVRTFHGRRTDAAGTITVGGQTGSSAEGTASGVAAAQTGGRLGVGASRTGANFAACIVRAVILYKGNYAGKQATVNTWAAAYHGATL